MRRKLALILPAILLLGFLAIKPPAIGSETNQVVVTPEATITPTPKPQLRDFDDEGNEPEHYGDRHHGDDHEDQYGNDDENEDDHGDDHGDHHEDDELEEDSDD